MDERGLQAEFDLYFESRRGLMKNSRKRCFVTGGAGFLGSHFHPQTEDNWGNVNPIGHRS
jgi:hypothetical protein